MDAKPGDRVAGRVGLAEPPPGLAVDDDVARLGAEPGRDQGRNRTEAIALQALGQRGPRGIEEQVADGRDPTADDHELGIEGRDQSGCADTEPGPDRRERTPGHLVPGLGEGSDLGTVEMAPQRHPGHAFQGTATAVLLPATVQSALAPEPVRHDLHVAELPRPAVPATQQPAVGDDAAPDADLAEDHKHVGPVGIGRVELSDRGEVGLVVEVDRQVRAPLGTEPLALSVLAGVALPAMLLLHRRLRVMMLGDDLAAGLGVTVDRHRALAMLGVVLLVAGTCAVCGPIAFVALLAGPIGRRLHQGRTRLVDIALIGALMVVVADHIGAYLVPGGANLPVGVVTGLAGAPFLLWLIVTRTRVET